MPRRNRALEAGFPGGTNAGRVRKLKRTGYWFDGKTNSVSTRTVHGGVTTTGRDATHPPTIFQTSGGGSSRGSGGGGGVPPGGRGGGVPAGGWRGGLAGGHGGVQQGVSAGGFRVTVKVRVEVSPRVRVRVRARVRARARVVVAVRACSPPVAVLQVKIFSCCFNTNMISLQNVEYFEYKHIV